jgi:hypothetical protein
MTHHPDDHQPPDDGPGGRGEGNPKLDEDAAWRDIVANFGDTALFDPLTRLEGERVADAEDAVAEPPVTKEPEKPVEINPRLFDQSHLEPLNTEATWDDEGHFVPPTPPPLPTVEPRRKIAWIALFGCPLVMLMSAIFRFSYPDWFSFLMVTGFVGGFVYLVATMPRKRHDDWSGDDGAVV